MVERRHPRSDGSTARDSHGVRLSRYDLVLAVVPAAFLVALLLSRTLGVPAHLSVTAAGLLSAVALADGLFLNPPRRPRVGDGAT